MSRLRAAGQAEYLRWEKCRSNSPSAPQNTVDKTATPRRGTSVMPITTKLIAIRQQSAPTDLMKILMPTL
jgi:hypothetical protein